MSRFQVATSPIKPSPRQVVMQLSQALRNLGITLDFEPYFTLELKRWAHSFDITIELLNSKHELRMVSEDAVRFLLDSLFIDEARLLSDESVEFVWVRLTKHPQVQLGCVEIYFNAMPKHDYKALLYSFSFLKPGTPVLLSKLSETSKPPLAAPYSRFCQRASFPNIL